MSLHPYKQFIERNHDSIAEVISTFHELNRLYKNQFLISMDSQDWEIYDMRVSKPIYRGPFKKCRDICIFMRELILDISQVRVINQLYKGDKLLKRTELWAAKRILRMYDFDEYFFTNPYFINYLINGKITNPQEKTDSAYTC